MLLYLSLGVCVGLILGVTGTGGGILPCRSSCSAPG